MNEYDIHRNLNKTDFRFELFELKRDRTQFTNVSEAIFNVIKPRNDLLNCQQTLC